MMRIVRAPPMETPVIRAIGAVEVEERDVVVAVEVVEVLVEVDLEFRSGLEESTGK